MPKPKPLTDLLGHASVLIRQLVWLPAAGLPFSELPPALEEFLESLPGKPDHSILKALPMLEPFAQADDEIDVDDFARVLEGTDGFLVQMETPKRRWFSDGTARINWGDTWTEWAYAPNQAAFEGLLMAFVASVIERDGEQFARIEPEEVE